MVHQPGITAARVLLNAHSCPQILLTVYTVDDTAIVISKRRRLPRLQKHHKDNGRLEDGEGHLVLEARRRLSISQPRSITLPRALKAPRGELDAFVRHKNAHSPRTRAPTANRPSRTSREPCSTNHSPLDALPSSSRWSLTLSNRSF